MKRTGTTSRRGTRLGRRGAVLFAPLLVLTALAASPALAKTFQVNPVVVEITPGRRTGTISVTNQGTEAVPVRVTLYRWTQQDGQDVYTPVDVLIASPPMFTIAPGRTQHVRIGPRGDAVAGAYRVMVEEIPSASADPNRINIALRLNLPLYIYAQRGGQPQLNWSAWRNPAGEVIIEARNSGARHSQILGINALNAAGFDTPLSTQMGVVLPGAARRWNAGTRSELIPGSEVTLSIRSTTGETRHNLVVLETR